MFTRKEEKGSTLGEMVIAIAIASGMTAMVTPAIMDMMDSVDNTAQTITVDKVEALQQQADATGTITMSAEDFKELTDKLILTCSE